MAIILFFLIHLEDSPFLCPHMKSNDCEPLETHLWEGFSVSLERVSITYIDVSVCILGDIMVRVIHVQSCLCLWTKGTATMHLTVKPCTNQPNMIMILR